MRKNQLLTTPHHQHHHPHYTPPACWCVRNQGPVVCTWVKANPCHPVHYTPQDTHKHFQCLTHTKPPSPPCMSVWSAHPRGCHHYQLTPADQTTPFPLVLSLRTRFDRFTTLSITHSDCWTTPCSGLAPPRVLGRGTSAAACCGCWQHCGWLAAC